MKIEVSNGEIIDKLTIIQIKLEEIKDEQKLVNLRREWEQLKQAAASILPSNDPLYEALYKINKELWNIENKIREFEKDKSFGADFIETARQVYMLNDERFELKRKINQKTSSHLHEEKSYEN